MRTTELMSRDTIIELIRANRAKLDELHVKSLAIFGSVARGDDRPDSDLDVLVEFEGWRLSMDILICCFCCKIWQAGRLTWSQSVL